MTKVEIDGKTYCVETLIFSVERLTKEVKASAEYHRLVLEQIRDEIKELSYPYNLDAIRTKSDVLQIIDKYVAK